MRKDLQAHATEAAKAEGPGLLNQRTKCVLWTTRMSSRACTCACTPTCVLEPLLEVHEHQRPLHAHRVDAAPARGRGWGHLRSAKREGRSAPGSRHGGTGKEALQLPGCVPRWPHLALQHGTPLVMGGSAAAGTAGTADVCNSPQRVHLVLRGRGHVMVPQVWRHGDGCRTLAAQAARARSACKG